MDKPSNLKSGDKAKHSSPQNSSGQKKTKAGVKKIYDPSDEQVNSGKVNTMLKAVDLNHTRLDLPSGPVIQVHSTRMRGLVDTFLKNTSRVHTAFRQALQGTDGGFQGDMGSLVLAYFENDICSAALACTNSKAWFIHTINPDMCEYLLDIVPDNLIPNRIEGETKIISWVLGHKKIKAEKILRLRDCVHMELVELDFPLSTGGHHRLAQTSDIPRLDEYAREFEDEIGYPPPSDWETLITTHRIFLGLVEGTPACVAIRRADTLDHVLIDGIYTFKPFRRRGLAKKLIAAIAQQASGRGQAARTIVGKTNKTMLSMMESLQFHQTADYSIAELEHGT